jgi:cephalosporin hydroxylase
MQDDTGEFQQQRRALVADYQADKALEDAAQQFMLESLRAKYSYNFDWMGLPIIQYPQDMIALQEIIWKCRPDIIVETGVARGGSLVFYASLLQLLGGDGVVLGIDNDLREHNRRRILQHPLSHRIHLLDGSSVADEMAGQVKQLCRDKKSVMVILDSNHTHEHVLKELELYSPLVSPGSYLVVFDTIIELMPKDYYKDRPWNRGDNPSTAVRAFLQNAHEWENDSEIESKLLITAARGGFLYRKS